MSTDPGDIRSVGEGLVPSHPPAPSRTGASAAGLRGCRVLDLAGPSGQYCGKLLADLGANVLKIEPPGGDPARSRAPFAGEGAGPECSLFFAYYNTNKRSLAIDLKCDAGREILWRLLANADVVIQTVGLDGEASPVLDYSELVLSYPGLILTSLSGFGTDGPYASYAATSLVVFAMSGIMKAIGPVAGPPAGMPGQIALDVAAGDAAAGTLLALLARRRTGRGQHVEVAAFEVLATQIGAPAANRVPASRSGHLHRQLAPSGVYRCKDGAVEFSTLLPGQWQRLKQLLADTLDLQAPEWDDRAYRIANADRLYAIVAAAVRDRDKAELTEQAQRLQIPCLPVNSVADFLANEHVEARGFFRQVEIGQYGRHAFPGAPYRLSEPRWALRRPAPALGEDTMSVLRDELRYSAGALDELREAGVIAGAGL
ncbi:MAG TPA: CoA transferase [Dehalococcoidia bacterium]|nr:CoA transferase [Dehalococcoidia bacterium]